MNQISGCIGLFGWMISGKRNSVFEWLSAGWVASSRGGGDLHEPGQPAVAQLRASPQTSAISVGVGKRPTTVQAAVWPAALALHDLLVSAPTGCGKTRFVEYMAWKLGRPLVTLACNEDMTAADLVGRWLLDADGLDPDLVAAFDALAHRMPQEAAYASSTLLYLLSIELVDLDAAEAWVPHAEATSRAAGDEALHRLLDQRLGLAVEC